MPAPLSNPIKGVAAMVAATALLVANDAVAKHLSQVYPVGQILFWRQMFGVAVILGVLALRGQTAELRVTSWGAQLLRAALFVVNTFLIVYCLSILPLPLVSSVLFTSPIIIALLSGPLLGETVGPRRWIAALLGFAGVLVIVRPGTQAFTAILLLPLVPAIVSSLRDIVTRRMTRTETSLSILFWSNALMVPAGLASLPLASPWQPVTGVAAAWLIFNGLLNLGAHFLMIHALRIADASLIAPFKYTGLIWAFLLGFVIWGYAPDVWTLAGALLIVASGLYAIERKPKPPAAAPDAAAIPSGVPT